MQSPITRLVTSAVALILGLIAIDLLINTDKLHMYQSYVTGTSPAVDMRYANLAPEMDEAAVRKHFDGLALRCITQSRQANGLGDRVCYANIDKADGQTAMTIATFFDRGRLKHTLVHIPWWAHGETISALVQAHGKADRAGLSGLLGGPVLRWQLPDGTLEMNRDRALDPLEWSTLFFTVQPR